MTAHSGFSTELMLHFFAVITKPDPPVSLFPTPICVFSGISGFWSGPKAKMLSGNKNQG